MKLFENMLLNDKMARAHEQRETFMWPSLRQWATTCGGEDFVKRERYRNFVKNSKDFPLVEHVTKVRVMPCCDGGFTVSLIDVDGVTCTFWTEGELPQRKPMIDGAHQGYRTEDVSFPVRSITSY